MEVYLFFSLSSADKCEKLCKKTDFKAMDGILAKLAFSLVNHYQTQEHVQG